MSKFKKKKCVDKNKVQDDDEEIADDLLSPKKKERKSRNSNKGSSQQKTKVDSPNATKLTGLANLTLKYSK